MTLSLKPNLNWKKAKMELPYLPEPVAMSVQPQLLSGNLRLRMAWGDPATMVRGDGESIG
jgi:hypothetical protein